MDGDSVDFGFVNGPDSIFTLQGHTGKFWILPGEINSVAYDENGDNTYQYTFMAQDGRGGRSDQTIYVHILPAVTSISPSIIPSTTPSALPSFTLPTASPIFINHAPVWTSDPDYYLHEGENIEQLGQFGKYTIFTSDIKSFNLDLFHFGLFPKQFIQVIQIICDNAFENLFFAELVI